MTRHSLPCTACRPDRPCRQFRMAEADERQDQSVAAGLDRLRWENLTARRPDRDQTILSRQVWDIASQRWEWA